MNTINEARSKGFSEVLASLQTKALVQQDKQISNPVRQRNEQHSRKTELMIPQLTINESFWNMVVAASMTSEGQGSFREKETESAKKIMTDASVAHKLISAYETKASDDLYSMAYPPAIDSSAINPLHFPQYLSSVA